MTFETWRRHLAPTYLLACLLLGGSAQGAWPNALLRLAGVGILAWAAIEGPREPLTRTARQLILLVGAMIALLVLQFMPLPPAIWTHLPGREAQLSGFATLGLSPGWEPWSLAPFATLSAALALLPPIAMLAAVVLLRAYTKVGLVLALVTGTILGLGLGVLQVTSPEAEQGRFYLQHEFNGGTPSGFFANPNHMATLLLLNIPFLAAVLKAGGEQGKSRSALHARWFLGGVAILVMVAGILLNRSLAALAILVPVSVASAILLFRLPRLVRLGLIVGAAALLVAFAAILFSPLRDQWLRGDAVNSVSTRHDFFVVGSQVGRDYSPAGSGIGTFAQVYRQREPFGTIDPTVFVNHAHDDYLELWIEAGLPGLCLVAIFLFWWFSTVRQMLRDPSSDAFARAGSIGSAAVLIHSLVDFPLRTAAIGASFVMCLGVMLISRRSPQRASDLRPTRHIEIR